MRPESDNEFGFDSRAAALAAPRCPRPAATEPQSSVELAQNARGATQIVVKVYHRDPQQAAATAQRLYDDLAATYRATAVADGRVA